MKPQMFLTNICLFKTFLSLCFLPVFLLLGNLVTSLIKSLPCFGCRLLLVIFATVLKSNSYERILFSLTNIYK